MTKGNSNTPALLLSLLVTLGLLGAGIWLLGRNILSQLTASPSQPQTASPQAGDPATPSSPAPSATEGALQLDTSLPNPTILTMDGSVTMVALIKQLQLAYLQINPSLPSTYGVPDGTPNGTNVGLDNLIAGETWIAASSRPLTVEEIQAGLKPVPIARDALAVVVGADNPYEGELTLEQLKQIFQGRITNWSELGGPDLPIRVINRSPDSGSYSLFKDVVLLGQAFAPDGPNFVTLNQDETTPMLRALGNNGIGYTAVSQAMNQQTVRIIPIEGVLPTDQDAIRNGSYPISRVVYLAVKQPTAPAVKQFIDLVLSPQGQAIVQRTGFVPL